MAGPESVHVCHLASTAHDAWTPLASSGIFQWDHVHDRDRAGSFCFRLSDDVCVDAMYARILFACACVRLLQCFRANDGTCVVYIPNRIINTQNAYSYTHTHMQITNMHTHGHPKLTRHTQRQNRFDYPECEETRSWLNISRTYKGTQGLFFTGGMGPSSTDAFRVWACFRSHPCLYKVAPGSYTDAMCYMYHEHDKSWHPWGLMSEVRHCSVAVSST